MFGYSKRKKDEGKTWKKKQLGKQIENKYQLLDLNITISVSTLNISEQSVQVKDEGCLMEKK